MPVPRKITAFATVLLIAAFVIAALAPSQGIAQSNDPSGRSAQEEDDWPEIPVRRNDRVIAPSGVAEYIVLSPASQAQAAANALASVGGQLVRQRAYPALGQTGLIFTLGGGLTPQAARRALETAAPDAVLSLHVLYRYAQGSPQIFAHEMVGLTNVSSCPLRASVTIGVIDGPVNPGHQALSGAVVTAESVLLSGDETVSAEHGTAVAALIAGQGGALTGMASGARIHAVSAFARSPGGEGASTERVIAALDRLVGQGVRLINMSFAGPPSEVLATALSLAAGRGVTMIAAAGNDGLRFAPYPAGSPHVIAVTAVDSRMRLYRSANTGGHIEFAAPGVDVFVASPRGGTYQSGTSYAAPIITALAARLAAGGSVDTVRQRLRSATLDLGAPGRDGQFGWGLVRAGGC